MSYRVRLTHEAERELLDSAIWWSENRDPDQAVRWLDGFEAAIATLADRPERHALIPEANQFTEPLRQLNFGLGRRPTHRAVFRIRGGVVELLTIRHLAQDELSSEDLQ